MSSPKITIIGAGSFFTNAWVRDIALSEKLNGGTFALIDLNERRLGLSDKMAEKLISKLVANWTVTTSTDRRELMLGSDYLINVIEVSGWKTTRKITKIKKYGIDQCIGDTVGPGGIMKAFRTIPAWIDILRDAEELCPHKLNEPYAHDDHGRKQSIRHADSRPLSLRAEHVKAAGWLP